MIPHRNHAFQQSKFQKPQLQFKDTISNEDVPFVPKLRIKHHALDRPTKSGLTMTSDQAGRQWLSDMDTTSAHPYQQEILSFQVRFVIKCSYFFLV